MTTITTTDATLLRLMWLASPALPVGAFSYSEGLEAAIDDGLVHDGDSARAWLLDQLWLALARADLPVAAAAWQAWRKRDGSRIAELNRWFGTTRETAEQRLQAEQTGRSLADWLRRQDRDDPRIDTLLALQPAPCWPIAFALAAECCGAAPRESLLAMAFGWAENMVQAALKAVPLGQSAGQRILGALADALPAAVDAALAQPDDLRRAFTPRLAILSSRHEVQYSRLFRS